MNDNEIVDLLSQDEFRTNYIERYLNKSDKLKTEKSSAIKEENYLSIPNTKLEEVYNNIKDSLKDKTILVFNIEMLNHLVNMNIVPKNLTYVYDNMDREEFASIYNVHIKSMQDVQKDKLKYDIVICFPPPNCYRKFFHMVNKLYSELLVFISPSIWLLSNKPSFNKMKNSCYLKKMNVILYNGNPLYKIPFLSPFADCYIFNEEGVVTIDNLLSKHEKTSIFENSFYINLYGNSETFKSIFYKIQIALDRYGSIKNQITDREYPFYFGISKIRGHVYMNEDVLYKDDFYTFYPEKEMVTTEKDKTKYHVGFNTYEEALSFKSYLDTKTAQFCLSLVKFNTHLNRGELAMVPFITYGNVWTDDSLKTVFDFTDMEMDFILRSL